MSLLHSWMLPVIGLGACTHGRPAPAPDILPSLNAVELAALPSRAEPEARPLAVRDHIRGGSALLTDAIVAPHGDYTHHLLIYEGEEPIWEVSCRNQLVGDDRGYGVEHVCFLDPVMEAIRPPLDPDAMSSGVVVSDETATTPPTAVATSSLSSELDPSTAEAIALSLGATLVSVEPISMEATELEGADLTIQPNADTADAAPPDSDPQDLPLSESAVEVPGGQKALRTVRKVPSLLPEKTPAASTTPKEAPTRLAIALAAPADGPLQGVLLMDNVVISRVTGIEATTWDEQHRPGTAGYQFRDPENNDRTLGYVTSVRRTGNSAWLGRDLSPEEREALAPALLVLASTPEFRADAEGEAIEFLARSGSSGFSTRTSTLSAAPETSSVKVLATAASGEPAAARALARAEATRESWSPRPSAPAARFGPDLREEKNNFYFTVHFPIGLELAAPIGAEEGRLEASGYLSAGLEAFDFAELSIFGGVGARHPIADEALNGGSTAIRVGLASRLVLVRLSELRLI